MEILSISLKFEQFSTKFDEFYGNLYSLSLSVSLSQNLKISKSLPLKKRKNETDFYDDMFSVEEVAIATITTRALY